MKTLKLDVDYDYDFALIALVSPLKEYKLAWHVNNVLDIALAKKDDLLLENKQGGRMYIQSYLFETDNSYVRLLKNKSFDFSNIPKPYLLSELKEYDYFLQVGGAMIEEADTSWCQNLQSLKEIQMASTVDFGSLKSKENLIF